MGSGSGEGEALRDWMRASAQERIERIASEARAKREGILRAAREAAERIVREALEAAEARLEAERRHAENVSRLNRLREEARLVGEIAERAAARARELASSQRGSGEGRRWLAALLDEALAELPAGAPVVVAAAPEDARAVEERLRALGREGRVRAGDVGAGVVVETSDGVARVENTIEARIESARGIWAARLREAIFGGT